MLRITQSVSNFGAIRYFMEHLGSATEAGAYLAQDMTTPAIWSGRISERLELEGVPVTVAAFAAVVHNFDPRKVDAREFEARLREAMRPPARLDPKKVRLGSRVRIPWVDEGTVVALNGTEATVRTDGQGPDHVLELSELRSPLNRMPEAEPHERLTKRKRKTAGYELQWSVPKSVSLLAAAGDTRIASILQAVVGKVMREHVEPRAEFRYRTGGGNSQDEERAGAGLLWANFLHDRARPVLHEDGRVTVDPDLHIHTFIQNVTYDEEGERFAAWKAQSVVEHAPFFQEVFHAELARELYRLGYDVSRRGGVWEVVGVTPEDVSRFSLRKAEAEAYADEAGMVTAKEREKAGAKSRSSKALGKDIGDLRTHMQARHPEVLERLERIMEAAFSARGSHRSSGPLSDPAAHADAAVAYALEHQLERGQVAWLHDVIAHALRWGGASFALLDDILHALERRRDVVIGDAERFGKVPVTTREKIRQENELIDWVKAGFDAHAPVDASPELPDGLTDDQAYALRHVLTSTDEVLAIRGKAGTGKSHLLGALARLLRHRPALGGVVALAPTANASRGALREDVTEDADTIAKFLGDSVAGGALRQKARGGFVILDEAGLASTGDLHRLMTETKALGARTILVGDSGQMHAVQGGDGLRLLEDEGALRPAELKRVLRQKEPRYRRFVEQVAGGQLELAFETAKEAGFVSEVSADAIAAGEAEEGEDADPELTHKRLDQAASKTLAHRLVKSIGEGKSTIAVAPTHALGGMVTAEMRKALKRRGILGQDLTKKEWLAPVDVREADKEDAAHALTPGDAVVMRAPDVERALAAGERLKVVEDERGKRVFERTNGTRLKSAPPAKAFEAYRSRTIGLAAGDQVMATEPIAEAGMERGDRGEVASVRDGRIHLKNGRSVPVTDTRLGFGYATTQNAGQGQTADHAGYVATGQHLPAVSKEGGYVAISRGKWKLDIVTHSAKALKEAMKASSARPHARSVGRTARALERKLAVPGPEAPAPKKSTLPEPIAKYASRARPDEVPPAPAPKKEKKRAVAVTPPDSRPPQAPSPKVAQTTRPPVQQARSAPATHRPSSPSSPTVPRALAEVAQRPVKRTGGLAPVRQPAQVDARRVSGRPSVPPPSRPKPEVRQTPDKESVRHTASSPSGKPAQGVPSKHPRSVQETIEKINFGAHFTGNPSRSPASARLGAAMARARAPALRTPDRFTPKAEAAPAKVATPRPADRPPASKPKPPRAPAPEAAPTPTASKKTLPAKRAPSPPAKVGPKPSPRRDAAARKQALGRPIRSL